MTDGSSSLESLQTKEMLSKKVTDQQRNMETAILPHNNVPKILRGMILFCECEWEPLFFSSLVVYDFCHGDENGFFSL